MTKNVKKSWTNRQFMGIAGERCIQTDSANVRTSWQCSQMCALIRTVCFLVAGARAPASPAGGSLSAA